MADRISLRKARSGHVPTPEPTRADDAPTTPRGGVLSSRDAFAAAFGERPSEQTNQTYTTVYDPLTDTTTVYDHLTGIEGHLAGWGNDPIDVDEQARPYRPPQPAPLSSNEGQRLATNIVTVNSPPLDQSVLQRISDQVVRAFRRQHPQSTIEPEDVPPTITMSDVVTARMSGPPMPNLSSIPRTVQTGPHAVRVGPSLEEQAVGFARAETITVQSWDDIRTREHVYSLRLNGATPDTRVTYEAMEMIGDNEEDKARYWSRAIASQLVRNLEADVAERLYELLRNNGRMG